MSAQCKRIVTLRLQPLDKVPVDQLKRVPPYPRVLVYEQIPPVCQPVKEPTYSAPGAAHGVTIKVCNYSRMCQACRPPPLCDCKPIICGGSGGAGDGDGGQRPPGKKLMKRMVTLAKAGLFVAFANWLFDIGVFGNAKNTRELLQKIEEELRKFFFTLRRCVQSDAAKYDMARMRYNLKNVWNMLIESIFRSMISIPKTLAGVPALLYTTFKPAEEPKDKDVKGKKEEKKPAPKKKEEKKPPPKKKEEKKPAPKKKEEKKPPPKKKEEKKPEPKKKEEKKPPPKKKEEKKPPPKKKEEKKPPPKKKEEKKPPPKKKEEKKPEPKKKEEKKPAPKKKEEKKPEPKKKDDKAKAAAAGGAAVGKGGKGSEQKKEDPPICP